MVEKIISWAIHNRFISGAYLLNSAWKVKQGGGVMEGMDM